MKFLEENSDLNIPAPHMGMDVLAHVCVCVCGFKGYLSVTFPDCQRLIPLFLVQCKQESFNLCTIITSVGFYLFI